jgi:4-amino-4-deoxy-L-arabinose transferase-like glycosyltransferase
MAWVSRRAPRTDRTRAAALLWGGWVLATGLVFSYMNGIIHPYYMVALAPGIAALTGIGATALCGGARGGRAPWTAPWPRQPGMAGRIAAACGVLASAGWAYVLLDRTPDWLPWLRWVIVLAGVAAAVLVLAGPRLAAAARSRRARLALAAAPLGLALVAGLAGPAAYTLDTVGSAHAGAIPSAGPQAAGFSGPGGGPGGQGGFPGTGRSGRGPAGTGAPGGTSTAPGGTAGTGAASGGVPGATDGMTRGGPGGDGGFGRGGGLGGDTTVSSALTQLLEQDAGSYKWVAATEGSVEAAPLELATGDAVMAIGGFNGTDPWPTLAVFKELVARHEIHYYVGQGSQSFGGGRGSSAIAAWVAAHFTKQTVGGQTVYDLTKPSS